MQSNLVNATLLHPRLMNIASSSGSKSLYESDDTFMNMLSERIAARKENGIENYAVKSGIQIRDKSNVQKAYSEPVKDEKTVTEFKKPETKTVDTKNMVSDKSHQDIKSEKVDGDNKLKSKEEIEEEIKTLEAMIALLEELLARLDVKTIEDVNPVFAKETLLPAGKESISPMELLSALVTQNIEKLKELISKMEQAQPSPETTAFMEKIIEILEKLNGKQENIKVLVEGLSEVEDMPSKEDLINQLKAQCSQLIDKLKEQVSTLKATVIDIEQSSETTADETLAGELISEQQPRVEIVKNEAKTQTQSEETKDEASSLGKKDETFERQLINDDDVSFDNAFLQNQQSIKEPLKETVTLSKAQLPLSEKPLAQTVTNQVMMKVKLMAGESKQEMEMHLKPESLGKLSLKIVHERGEILAKITAENQQVKEILESNMQMLKDALEKNGLTVQSLSVSVGNGNSNGSNKGNSKENAGTKARGMTGSHSKSSIIDSSVMRAKIEKEYYDNTSQINLTA